MTPETSRPEFSRPERIDAIGEGARTIAIEADAAERAALATRFGLVSIERLSARFAVRREAAGIAVTGEVEGAVVQACGVTGDPLPSAIREAVTLRFVEPAGAGEDEVEIGIDDIDTVEIEGGAIDLGEAAAETLALALDPFPRSPRAAAILAQAGVIGDDEVAPTGPLAGLKALIERK